MVAAGRFSRALRIAVCEQNPELSAAIPARAIKQVERQPQIVFDGYADNGKDCPDRKTRGEGDGAESKGPILV